MFLVYKLLEIMPLLIEIGLRRRTPPVSFSTMLTVQELPMLTGASFVNGVPLSSPNMTTSFNLFPLDTKEPNQVSKPGE